MQNRMRWVLIFWLFIISAIAYLDRINISVAISAIQKEFNFTNIQFGLGTECVCDRIRRVSSAWWLAGGQVRSPQEF